MKRSYSPLQISSSNEVLELWRSTEKISSEDDCLRLIDKYFPSASGHTPLGRGDDCAELAVTKNLAISTDAFFQDSHFRSSYFTPGEVGSKALTVAVSDLAAAGALPLGFSLLLSLPAELGENVLEDILASMAENARTHGIMLTGGDIIRSDKLGFSITVWGESVAADSSFFLRRAQTVPGEIIFVLGKLGLARTGLLKLEKEGREAIKNWPESTLAHLRPVALSSDGAALARLAYAQVDETVGLMDLSDGLTKDLPRLLGLTGKDKNLSLGAEIYLNPNIIPHEVYKYAEENNINPEDLILQGGEDFALLGTCSELFWEKLRKNLPGVQELGRVSSKLGLFCNGKNIKTMGFDHFSDINPKEKMNIDFISTESSSAGRDILDICHKAWDQGLMKGFSGNISCRITMPHPFIGDYYENSFINKSATANSEPEEASLNDKLKNSENFNLLKVDADFEKHQNTYDESTLSDNSLSKKEREKLKDLSKNLTKKISDKYHSSKSLKDSDKKIIESHDNTDSADKPMLLNIRKNTDSFAHSPAKLIPSNKVEAFIISGTKVPKGNIKACDLALISLIDGKNLMGAKASSETSLHLRIYQECPQSKVILHVHPPHMLALSLIQEEGWLDLPLVESALHSKKLGYVDRKTAGSIDLAEAVAAAAREYEAVWMRNHGLVIHGADLNFALALAEELEQLAKIKLLAMQA